MMRSDEERFLIWKNKCIVKYFDLNTRKWGSDSGNFWADICPLSHLYWRLYWSLRKISPGSDKASFWPFDEAIHVLCLRFCKLALRNAGWWCGVRGAESRGAGGGWLAVTGTLSWSSQTRLIGAWHHLFPPFPLTIRSLPLVEIPDNTLNHKTVRWNVSRAWICFGSWCWRGVGYRDGGPLNSYVPLPRHHEKSQGVQVMEHEGGGKPFPVLWLTALISILYYMSCLHRMR